MNTGKPEVSIIIPVYNEAPKRLNRAVTSALAQRGCAIEIIVVNDGSTEPATMQALAKISAQDVIVLHQRNEGLPAARNAGIAASQGEFILPLDSDDAFGPHTAQRCMQTLRSRPDAAVAVPIITAMNEKTGKKIFSADSAPEFDLPDFCIANPIHACSMFRKADWKRFGGYDASLAGVGFEDYEWWVRLLATGRKAVAVPGTEFFYFKRPDSMSAEMQKNQARALLNTRMAMLRNSPGLGDSFALLLWSLAPHKDLQKRR